MTPSRAEKVTAAYVVAERLELPEGGAQVAMQTVTLALARHWPENICFAARTLPLHHLSALAAACRLGDIATIDTAADVIKNRKDGHERQ